MVEETVSGTISVPAAVEVSGDTVDEAISKALDQLGISTDEAEITVISTGSKALPGESISGTAATVRVQKIDAHTAAGRNLLEDLLAHMEISARVGVRRAAAAPDAESTPPAVLDVTGDDLGLLIGWRGETLRALQTTVNLMMGEEGPDSRRLIVDVERYRARREEQVRDLALRLADRVKRSGERYVLDPMQPYERRMVHLTLAQDSGVRTESAGREPARRVIIHPTGPAEGGYEERRPRGRRW